MTFSPDILPGAVRAIAEAVRGAGGEAFVVGGAVRDIVLGVRPTDVDIEVHDLAPDALMGLLASFGRASVVGVSFGVIKVKIDDAQGWASAAGGRTPGAADAQGWASAAGGRTPGAVGEIDVSLPRRGNAPVTRGDLGETDPSMPLPEALSRRDFTMNAMALDPRDGSVVDPFEGRADLRAGVLRSLPGAFAADPLRVLRGMSFCGRFRLHAEIATIEAAHACVEAGRTLPKERVWGEFAKWAGRSSLPSAGLRFLRESRWVSLFPELHRLDATPQDEEWHPEGNVWLHTKHTVDAAAVIATREGLSDEDRLLLLLAALCHDLGKPATTERIDGRLRSRGHERLGGTLAEKFLAGIGAPVRIVDPVSRLVAHHLAPYTTKTPSAVRRLSRALVPATIDMLVLLIEADHSGRPPYPARRPNSATELLRLARELDLHDSAMKPIVLGRHLKKLGVEPGPEMGRLLDEALRAQEDGAFTDLDGAVAWVRERLERNP